MAASSTDGKCAVFLLIHSHFPKRQAFRKPSELSYTRVLIFVQFLRAKHQIIILHKAVSAGEVLIHCRFLHGKLMESKCFPSVHRALNARRIALGQRACHCNNHDRFRESDTVIS